MTKVLNIMKKLLLLGDAAVGKTSLVRRFVFDNFDDEYVATIGTKTTAKAIQFKTDKELINLKLQIWDILGQRGYSRLHHSSFKGTNGVIMVADITRWETLQSLEKYWIPKTRYLAGNIPFIILANKSDLMRNAEFNAEGLTNFASRYNVKFYLTSAKKGKNVNQAFYLLGQYMINPRGVEPSRPKNEPILHPRIIFGDAKGEISQLIDRIIDDFGKEFSDLEVAMPIIQRQFELAEIDINRPSLEGLKRFVDRLEVVEMSFKKKEVAEADRIKRLKWIEEIKFS
jgi:Ras-related protein Rab-1A